MFYLQSFRRGSRLSHTCGPRFLAVCQQNGTAVSMFCTANHSTGRVFGGENLMVIHVLEKSPTFMVTPSVYKVRPWNVSCVSLINSTLCKIHFHFLPSTLKSSLFPSDFLANMLYVFVISRVHGTCSPQIILFDLIPFHPDSVILRNDKYEDTYVWESG